jgi:hypothetical protein
MCPPFQLSAVGNGAMIVGVSSITAGARTSAEMAVRATMLADAVWANATTANSETAKRILAEFLIYYPAVGFSALCMFTRKIPPKGIFGVWQRDVPIGKSARNAAYWCALV